MDLIRTVIRVFHTDADGVVDPTARLVPGLQRADAGGQSSFRLALAQAAAAESVTLGGDNEEPLTVAPHQLRASLITHLAWDATLSEGARRRYSGHAVGHDVHSRHYVLDDPQLRPMTDAAIALDTLLTTQVPDGLAVPTPVRCTTGNQPALARRAALIDEALLESGWLLPPTADGEPLLGADEVAALLDIAPTLARRWMAHGRLPCIVVAERARGAQRMARLSDVEALRGELDDRVTVAARAQETGRTYHAVYAVVTGLGHHVESDAGIPDEIAGAVRDRFLRTDAILAVALPLTEAAGQIDGTVTVVRGLLDRGDLVEHDRLPDGRRTVTRDSVTAYLSRPRRRRRRR